MKNDNLDRWIFLSAIIVLGAFAGGANAGARRGYEHDAAGNLKRVVDVTSDNANCGAIGSTCGTTAPCCDGSCCPGLCQSNTCCIPTTCGGQFATCGTLADGCGTNLVCGNCGAGRRCAGLTCFLDQPTAHAEPDNATGDLTVLAGTFDVEVWAQFVSSKGAYASALSFLPRASIPTTCPAINGGVNDCILYTGECAGLGGSKCPQDPNSAPGEISCWCKSPRRMPFQTITAGKYAPISTSLIIDYNVDGKSEELRPSSSRKGDPKKGYVRYYQVLPTVWRMEWEDALKPPAGDYNDYVAAVNFKDCDKTNFPPGIVDWPEAGLACKDGCNEGPCPDPLDSKPTDLRLAAKIMVDDERTETDRELRGRLLTLSVVAQSMNMQEMAFCPVVWFNYNKPSWDCMTSFAPDKIQIQEYGPPNNVTCKLGPPKPGANGLEPLCVKETAACREFPASLAREQLYKANACYTSGASRVGPGDVITLEKAGSCGASSTLLDFQLAIGEVDKLISDPTQTLSPRGADGLLNDPLKLISRVELFVFDRLVPGQAFHCPTGINVQFGGADPSVGRVRKYVFTNPSATPNPAPWFAKEVR